jgi:hypothetical protein
MLDLRQRSACLLTLSTLGGCVPTVQGAVNPARFSTLQPVAVLPFALPDGAPASLAEAFADEMWGPAGRRARP